MSSIAKATGVSRQRVHQIKSRMEDETKVGKGRTQVGGNK